MAFEDLTPTIKVVVEGNELSADVTSAIKSCTVDVSTELATEIQLEMVSPRKDEIGVGITIGEHVFLESRAFQPGNHIDVYMGYGNNLQHIGSGIIQRWLPNFSASGINTLTVRALDASVWLMNGKADINAKDARNFGTADEPPIAINDMVSNILLEYGIIPSSFNAVERSDRGVQKKSGMTDYKFIRGLANLVQFEFDVFYNTSAKVWQANFRQLQQANQAKRLLEVGGDRPTILSMNAEWGINDQPTDVKVVYFNKKTKIFEDFVVSEKETTPVSVLYTGGEDNVDQEITSVASFRIAAAGRGFDVITDRKFYSSEDAIAYAQKWLREKRDLFVTATGQMMGLPELQPRQVHEIFGIGTQLSGEWEFKRVTHKYDRDRGYRTDFFAHKVVA